MSFEQIVLAARLIEPKNFHPAFLKIFPRIVITEPVYYELPVSSDNGDNSFITTIGGKKLKFRFWYNRRMNIWCMSVYDELGDPIMEGKAAVLGTDFFGQCTDSRLPQGGSLVAVNLDDKQPGLEAGEFDLGVRVRLVYTQQEPI